MIKASCSAALWVFFWIRFVFVFMPLLCEFVLVGLTVFRRMLACRQELDFEVELAIVIGKKGRFISVKDAPAYIAGYTVAHGPCVSAKGSG